MGACRDNKKGFTLTYTMRKRTPSFDGIHAIDTVPGLVLRGPDNNDYIVKNNKRGIGFWDIYEKALYDDKVTHGIVEFIERPRIQIVTIIYQPRKKCKVEDIAPQYVPLPPKIRGRPPTVTHGIRQPSAYNIFVKGIMHTLPVEWNGQDKMRECARLWRLHKVGLN
jgi:hypothetical protein